MDAAQALADLKEISSQIQSAVIAEKDGRVLASTFWGEGQAARATQAARSLLVAAEETRRDPEPRSLVQLEAATPEGSVFLVRDGGRMIAATTTPEPTVGLVFYDLKSCLRTVAAESDEEAKPRPRARHRGAAEEGEGNGAA